MQMKMDKILTIYDNTTPDTTGYGGKRIILLYSRTNNVIMYSTSSGRIIRPEYSERGSGGYLRRPAASLGENNNDKYTSTRGILNQGHVNCLAVDSSTPKGVDHRMEGRSEDTILTDSAPNQDESYPAQPQEAEYMSVTTTQEPVKQVSPKHGVFT